MIIKEIAIPKDTKLQEIVPLTQLEWLIARSKLREKLPDAQYRQMGLWGLSLFCMEDLWREYLELVKTSYPVEPSRLLREKLIEDLSQYSLYARAGMTHLGTSLGFGFAQYEIAQFQEFDQARISTTAGNFYRESGTSRVDMYPRELVKMLGVDFTKWKSNLELLLTENSALALCNEFDLDHQLLRKLCTSLDVGVTYDRKSKSKELLRQISSLVESSDLDAVEQILNEHTGLVMHRSDMLCKCSGLVQMRDWFGDYLGRKPKQLRYDELVRYLKSCGVGIVKIELEARGKNNNTHRYYFAVREDMNRLDESQRVGLLQF